MTPTPIDPRGRAIGQLIDAASALMDSDPIEAGFVQKLAEKLLRRSRARPLTEVEVGEATGREDRERGRPPLSARVLKDSYSAAFARGYECGYKGSVAA